MSTIKPADGATDDPDPPDDATTERQQRWRAKVRKQKAAEPKLAKLRAKRERRAERELQLAEATRLAAQTLGTELYGVLYVDPPSDWQAWSWKGMDRAAG